MFATGLSLGTHSILKWTEKILISEVHSWKERDSMKVEPQKNTLRKEQGV